MESYYQNLTQQQLRQLYKTTGSLLLLDIPEGLQFGIDNILWQIGSKFRGLKFIPLGTHIISYTLKDENNMFKINKFLNFSSENSILIYKWNPKYSVFSQLKDSQTQGYRQGVRNFHFDSYLGPYPPQNLEFWRDNTNFITKKVLDKLDPINRIFKFQQQYGLLKSAPTQQLKVDMDSESDNDNQVQIEQEFKDLNVQQQVKQGMNKKFEELSDTIYYSQIPRRLQTQASHINKIGLDKTSVLLSVLSKQWGYVQGILGQIQYAFVYFLIGQDQQSFKQWKRLLHLIIFSESVFFDKKYKAMIIEDKDKDKIIDKFEQLALDFVIVLYNQLKQFPQDFFVNELSKDNFIEPCLRKLKSYTSSTMEPELFPFISKKVQKRLEKLFQLLNVKFSYQIQDTDQEDEPVVVQANESYF